MFKSITTVLLFCLSSLVFAQNDSAYTSIQPSDCRFLHVDEESGSSVSRCKGFAGYQLELLEGDLRQTLDLLSPSQQRFQLDYLSNVSTAFSFFGKLVEWRFDKSHRPKKPHAFIVRFNVSEDPEKPERHTSYLVVSKITPQQACITNIVRPQVNANQLARQLADQATQAACIQR